VNEKIEQLTKLFYGHSITYKMGENPIKIFGKTIKMQSIKIIVHPYRRFLFYDVSRA